MLLRQNRRRHQNGDLLVIGDRLESRTHGDFRLAIADIATDETVHRVGRLHVPFDFFHRAQLIGRFLEGESCLQLPLHRRVR